MNHNMLDGVIKILLIILLIVVILDLMGIAEFS